MREDQKEGEIIFLGRKSSRRLSRRSVEVSGRKKKHNLSELENYREHADMRILGEGQG